MLINCPRCGFSQPSDQYCAQCGVDMQSFKPKKQPFITRVFGNAGVQIVILILAAVFVGQYIFNSRVPDNWVQKIAHFQGMSTSQKAQISAKTGSDRELSDELQTPDQISATSAALQLENLRNRELVLSKSGDSTGASVISKDSSGSTASGGAQELGAVNFKVTYAEVSRGVLAKWITDSSNLGLYQNLDNYSAGIIYDFQKRRDSYQQQLKTSDIKLNPGNANTNLSGIMNEDGTQVVGLISVIEYKSNENEIIHGNFSITRSNAQSSEYFPAEFDLPKGAAFFIIGALKRENFVNERVKLVMPPFQIFKSADFMTRKTEFVIILEPDYK